MKLTKIYDDNFIGKQIRKKTEIELFKRGFEVESEEEVKEFNRSQACCLAIIFLPLALIPLLIKQKKIKVVYTNDIQRKADGTKR